MKISHKIKASIFSLVSSFFLSCYANAQANCDVFINRLPYIINSDNLNYCLSQDLNYNAFADQNLLGHYSIQDPANFWNDFPNINFTAAIRVTASNVTLDLNKHVLTASALVSNRVAIAVYANNVSNFKLLNGTIRGFDTGADIFSNDSAIVSRVTFDKIKLRAIKSTAANNNVIDANTVTLFSSINRWPKAALSIMEINGAVGNSDTMTIRRNVISGARTNSVDPTPNDGNPVWGTTGMQIVSQYGTTTISDNTLTNITANNGVMAYLYIMNGSHVILRNNTLWFPTNMALSSLQNLAVLEVPLGGQMILEANANRFSGFYTQFYSFNAGIQLIYSNNIFDVYPVNGNYPPLFVNYDNRIDAGGNKIIRH